MKCIFVMLADKNRMRFCKHVVDCCYFYDCPGYDKCNDYVSNDPSEEDDWAITYETGMSYCMTDAGVEKYTIPYEPLDAEEEMKLFRDSLRILVRAYSRQSRKIIRFMSE